MTSIHPTAIVASGAAIGTGVRIGPFCHVGGEAVLDAGVTLISHVVIDGHAHLGAGAMVYPFCTVGMAPQDLKYRGEPTRVEVGPRTQIREHVTIHRGTVTGRGVTHVGADCLIMAVAHVAHDCQVGNGVVIANNVVMGGHVSIGDNAVIGGAAAIHQYVRIGRAAMIGGVAGVEADVIPFGTVLGNRARLVGLNVVGLRRRGFERAQIQTLRAAFRLMFRGHGVFAGRVEKAREQFGREALVAEVLAFIDQVGPRGLIRSVAVADDEDAV